MNAVLMRMNYARVVKLSVEVELGPIMVDLKLCLVNSIDLHVARICFLKVLWEALKDTRVELEVAAVSCKVPRKPITA